MSMCGESVRTRWRATKWFTAHDRLTTVQRLDPDTMAVKRSVPPRRPRQQTDALDEAVRAHWRGVVRRIGSVDNTAQLGLDPDNSARLDPDTVAVEPSLPARRADQQNDASLHEAARAHWREVVRRALPVDNTTARVDLEVDNTAARAELDLDTTARAELDLDTTARVERDVDTTARVERDLDATARLHPDREPVKPSVAPRRPRLQNAASSHEAVGARRRSGDVVRRARPVDNTARRRRSAGRPSGPPPRPIQRNVGALHEAVPVSEANLWGLRVKRTAVAFAAVLLFVALVVFSGRPFGGDDQPAPQPSVPSAAADKGKANREPFHLFRVRIPKGHPAAHCHRPKACKRFPAS